MRATAAALCALAISVASAAAAEPVRVGVAAPLGDTAAILGTQVLDGAMAASRALPVQLEVADERCSAEGGAAAARAFVAARVEVAIGFLCTASVEAALPILAEARIPAITVGVRTDSLTDRREKTKWPVYRLAPRADGEAAAVAQIIPRLWRDSLFAIVDDGTIYGRGLAEGLRAAAEQAALKPVFVDTYRPQMDNQIGLIGRLRRAGATHVFVGGDRGDVAVMARDAAELDADITFAGGEALRAAAGDVQLAAGTIMVGLPEWAELAPPPILAGIRSAGVEPDGYVLPAYAAVEIAHAALTQARSEKKDLAAVLGGRDFKTAIGSVRFDAKGDLSQNPYRAFRFDGERFLPLEGG